MEDVSPSVAECMSEMASEILTLRARLSQVEAERDLLRQAHERAEVHLGETQDRLAAAEVRAIARGEGDRGE